MSPAGKKLILESYLEEVTIYYPYSNFIVSIRSLPGLLDRALQTTKIAGPISC